MVEWDWIEAQARSFSRMDSLVWKGSVWARMSEVKRVLVVWRGLVGEENFSYVRMGVGKNPYAWTVVLLNRLYFDAAGGY